MKILSLIVLADIIKSQRTKKNITQEQLYEQSGINRNMIGRIERMNYIPTIPQLEKLASVLSFDMEKVFVDENKPTVFTSFSDSHMTDEEQSDVDHLMDMILAAKQQIMLRKALHHE